MNINRVISKSKTLRDGLPVSMMVSVLVEESFKSASGKTIKRKVSLTRHVHLTKVADEVKYLGYDKHGSVLVYDRQGLVRDHNKRPVRTGKLVVFEFPASIATQVAA